ncbi:MAG: MAPEG family protein [Gammaproteobacteria bacterium]|nr:MAPEG family protein [Gammaproteobacteria bacterium]MDH5630206.1 MAPEG family protein [Gammaproteobacteria bacterium]
MLIIAGYAGVLGILYIVLSYQVVSLRRREKVGLGDGGNNDVLQAMRVHANFSEYVPISLILLMLIAQNGGAEWMLHTFGGLLVVARTLHAFGFSKKKGPSFGRYWGTLLTWLNLLVLSIINLLLVYTGSIAV